MLESSMLRVLLSSGQECWDLCFHGHRVCHFHLSRSHCHCQLHRQCFLQNEQWKITAINFNNAILLTIKDRNLTVFLTALVS